MDKIKACEGNVAQRSQLRVAVGIVNSARSELRVRVFLEALPDILRVEYLYPGCDIDVLIENADLVIGSKSVALKGVLHKKPVMVIGEYGSGGVLTPQNIMEQYQTGFSGKIRGEVNEYFSFEQFKHDIQKSGFVPLPYLEWMSTQFNNETLNDIYK